VEGAHFGLFFNHGQCCCAGPAVFVEEKIYDQFVEKSGARARKTTVGDSLRSQDRTRSASGSNAVRQGYGVYRIGPGRGSQAGFAAVVALEIAAISSNPRYSPMFRMR